MSNGQAAARTGQPDVDPLRRTARMPAVIVRSIPVPDGSLTSVPQGSTGYTVEVIDSTLTPHGATDWRALNAGQGLGYGTFVLFADSAGTIVASRWSPSDPNNNDTTIHPLAIGGLQ